MAGIEQFEDIEDIETRRQAALAWIEQQAQEPLPEVEEIPAHFYEDGIEGLEISLKLRQLELVERWQGNEDANMLSIIQELAKFNPQNFS
jgi:hypothetical protein